MWRSLLSKGNARLRYTSLAQLLVQLPTQRMV
jgi:hypothetical protein